MVNLADLEIPEGVDAAKAQRLIQWIVKLEAENEKTHKLNDSEMIHKIMTRIQGEAKCI
ncbi:hypothetical protein [Atopobium sp. oral taxon 810]|uniref:hypothetical protein n=1 Tax=Atopobium sp. oral taxon 810 TaxID=712158 RepID=UPI0003962887|nr:hypothetical protein [Atopobium sp. oral taxon 810]ERI06369.1 hypothetical protein HMPREF9069_00318 [Atopobium sp. oral taxon 810 str. F0209]